MVTQNHYVYAMETTEAIPAYNIIVTNNLTGKADT
jgi:hypothetical protein